MSNNKSMEIIGRADGDKVYIQEAPTFTDVFCPEVGWETARDGFCVACGATDHEKGCSE